jgi:hypothetical protein
MGPARDLSVVRSIARVASLAFTALGAAVTISACSAAPPEEETTGATESALTCDPATQTLQCVSVGRFHGGCMCVAIPDITTETTPPIAPEPSLFVETCSPGVPLPSALQGMNCTRGVTLSYPNGEAQPVTLFACAVEAGIPMRHCQHVGNQDICDAFQEAEIEAPGSTCVGNAVANWRLLAHLHGGRSINNGCDGPCGKLSVLTH